MLDTHSAIGPNALGLARRDGRARIAARFSGLSRLRAKRKPDAGVDAAPAEVSIAGRCALQATAEKAAVLVDGAAYFAALADALPRASRRIVIVGWDFDAGITLTPDRPGSLPLGRLLRGLVEATPELEVNILVWSLAVVHAPGAPLPLLVGEDWQAHPRIHLKLDTRHPIYASHHQKIVTVDEDLAFVGGIDLTVGRWDTADHAAKNPLRVNPDGSVYGPIHDLHMAISGPAARKVASYARDRWAAGAGEALEPPDLAPDASLWPAGLEAEFASIPVALARTEPKWRGRQGWQEGLCLTRDALLAARRAVYIELQYFSAAFLRPVLEELLARPDGPEIVLVLTEESHSFIEHVFMGRNRDRLLTRLSRIDRHGRLRAFHPVTDGAEPDKPCSILIHSKLVIVDDRIIRIGSSNLNNRSTGLDTEFDLAVEAQEPGAAAGIGQVRDRLIAEHVGADPAAFASAVAETGSLIAAVERFNGQAARRLVPISIDRDGPTRPILGTGLIDPRRPVRLVWPVMALLARLFGRRRRSGRPSRRWA
jgi:phosphatidylserine/phosphatidylglycerophosphate/cardiolipin synthase-like enzyme